MGRRSGSMWRPWLSCGGSCAIPGASRSPGSRSAARSSPCTCCAIATAGRSTRGSRGAGPGAWCAERMGTTAFVFAGGGSLGAVEVGMLRELVQSGVRPDFVVGSSVGALNAVHFAAVPTPEGVERLERIWRTVRRRDVFPVSPLGAMLRLLTGRGALVPHTALRRLLERYLPLARLEDAGS